MAFISPISSTLWTSSSFRLSPSRIVPSGDIHLVTTPRRRRVTFIVSAAAEGPSGDTNESSWSSNGTGSNDGADDTSSSVNSNISNGSAGNGTETEVSTDNADEKATSDTSSESDQKQTAVRDPFEILEQMISDGVNRIFDAVYPPLRAGCPILSAEWKEVYGNYIMYPSSSESMPVKSVIHFLGGAFFGAVPHHLYNSLLTRLCKRGHVIVATPYNLSFDYLPVADQIARAWERVEADLALEYGPLPIIGLGHSAGSVFHSLTSTLFEDATPKAGNILVSFNCRNARDAIPSYENLVDPLVKLAVSTANESVPDSVRESIKSFPEKILTQQQHSLFTPDTVKQQVIPLIQQGKRFFDQLDPLFNEIAYPSSASSASSSDSTSSATSKTREFYPPPHEIRNAIQNLYNVSETLVVKFTDDSLDDSDELTNVLTECERQQTQKNQQQPISHSVVELTGSHLTPLVQDPPDLASVVSQVLTPNDGPAPFPQNLVETIGGVTSEMVGAFGTRDLNKLEIIIDEWIDAGISSGKF